MAKLATIELTYEELVKLARGGRDAAEAQEKVDGLLSAQPADTYALHPAAGISGYPSPEEGTTHGA